MPNRHPPNLVIGPTPTATATPSNTPRYHVERVQAEDEWCRQVQLAMAELQKENKALKDRLEALENA